jgi:hypothetical protein
MNGRAASADDSQQLSTPGIGSENRGSAAWKNAAPGCWPGLETIADVPRYKLGRPQREDLTLELWIEIIREINERRN